MELFRVFGIILILNIAWTAASFGFNPELRADCPEPSTCGGCPLDWVDLNFNVKGTVVGEDLCDVTISWEWIHEDSDSDPLMIFLCQYESGSSCDIGNEQQCGSCEEFNLSGLSPSKNPSLSYSDTCGYLYDIPLSGACDGSTDPPQTTLPTSTSLPIISTEHPLDPTTVTEIDQRSTSSMTTSSSVIYCPSPSTCEGCPLDWGFPSFSLEGNSNDRGLCDVQISWEWDYDTLLVNNPNLNFICIYGANGDFCGNASTSVCGSCQSVTIYDIDFELDPYIDYFDTCSNIDQLVLGNDCQQITSPPVVTEVPTTPAVTAVTNPSSYCPSSSICAGCPSNYELPSIQQKGTLISDDNCTVEMVWNWPYSQSEANTRMVFVCVYTSGLQCQPLSEDVCASCETFTIYNVKPSESPVINYSDTCGFMSTDTLTSDCYAGGTTPPPPTGVTSPSDYCPYNTACYGCHSDFDMPEIEQKGIINGNDNCTVELTWNYPFDSPSDGEPVPRMVFVCVYSSGDQCQPLDEDVCASCEKFTIHNVIPSKNPVINYSDTCGNMVTLQVTSECSS